MSARPVVVQLSPRERSRRGPGRKLPGIDSTLPDHVALLAQPAAGFGVSAILTNVAEKGFLRPIFSEIEAMQHASLSRATRLVAASKAPLTTPENPLNRAIPTPWGG